MTQQQHTRAPWRVCAGYGIASNDPKYPLVASAFRAADAALIASAPELLDALLLAIATIDGFYAHDSDEEAELADVEEKLLAAVARATTTEEAQS